jgi:DNA topoisomerase-1
MAAHKGVTDEERTEHARRVLNLGARARWWRRCGSKPEGFCYLDAHGNPVTDEKQLARLAALAIPPGYTEVRISPSARSRLQAIGIDTCGRLQYRYHSDFTARQAAKKYEKIERFGEHLPKLRRITNEHIAEEGFGKARVLAVVVRLINDLYFRLGSEESVQRYRTYGVTTLRNHHLQIQPDGQLLFRFVGKHHIQQRLVLVDAELAALMHEIKAIKGSRLFNYLDEHGKPHAITPADVNHYIKSAMGPEFSGKDFRTWGGTLLAATLLAELGPPESERQAHKNIVAVARQVAERLGNTPTVCRECYIHPVVFTRYEQGVTLNDFRSRHLRAIRRCQPDYEPEELALLQLFHPPD